MLAASVTGLHGKTSAIAELLCFMDMRRRCIDSLATGEGVWV